MLTAILVSICSNYKLQEERAYLELMRPWMMTMAVIELLCPFPNLHNSIQFYLHLELQICNICFTVYSVSDRSLQYCLFFNKQMFLQKLQRKTQQWPLKSHKCLKEMDRSQGHLAFKDHRCFLMKVLAFILVSRELQLSSVFHDALSL